jgi:chaperonin GroES
MSFFAFMGRHGTGSAWVDSHPMPRASEPSAADAAGKARKPRAKKVTTAAANGADVRLTADRLVVRPPADGERKSAGGLLIPATAMPAPRRLSWADVHLVGPDVRVAKPGDRVLFLPSSGLEVELDGEDLVLLRERDVQAVTSPPASKKDRAPGQYL